MLRLNRIIHESNITWKAKNIFLVLYSIQLYIALQSPNLKDTSINNFAENGDSFLQICLHIPFSVVGQVTWIVHHDPSPLPMGNLHKKVSRTNNGDDQSVWIKEYCEIDAKILRFMLLHCLILISLVLRFQLVWQRNFLNILSMKCLILIIKERAFYYIIFL